MAEGGTMLDNKSKFADLKAMLDGNKENMKMDAMKRIISMLARGKDMSELFPQVVKNVAVKNLELKKLVYVYLVRYAEEQQDLALLSISTFQRGLKDPNQLIRASALRVLSSIRVQMIAPVMMLSIKESVRDMSAYVRKVAAHAIPKLYALDSDLQPQLVECIDFLLADKRTLVIGSAVYAFEETCPENLLLLHRHFRSLCKALADVDEWGQVIMIGLLTRYARTQFISPTAINQTDDDEDRLEFGRSEKPLDQDHMLLISSVKPLLQSRNCAVVMAVAQLLYYIAPPAQLALVPKALVRLLRGPNEVQYIVLMNIATICAARNNLVSEQIFAISKNLFEPFLKSFFVRGSDTARVKQVKLQVLTSLVNETNVQLVIRELQAYLSMPDLASHTIEAIGRCALQVESAADACLSCLLGLIATPREAIVSSAVVVLKRLLHDGAHASPTLLKRVVRLIDSVNAPTARACVLWLVGAHLDKVGHLAPDVLRRVAKRFPDEDDCVKLQALSLAAKLWATQREKCELLVQYVLQLARYDRSYDIRDRCRFIRNALTNPKCRETFPSIAEVFLAEKPVPTLMQSAFASREHYQLGSLSHLLNQSCTGYAPLPKFPAEPDEEGRRVRKATNPIPVDDTGQGAVKTAKAVSESFYSTSDEEGEDEEGSEEVEEEEQSGEEEAEDEEETDESDEEEEDSDEESSSPKSDEPTATTATANPTDFEKPPAAIAPTDMELLLDLDFNSTVGPMMGSYVPSRYVRAAPQYTPEDYFPLISAINAQGLSVEGRFTRSPSHFANSMVTLELRVKSQGGEESEGSDVCIAPKSTNSATGNATSGPVNVYALTRGEKKLVTLGIDFADSARVSEWLVSWRGRDYEMRLEAPMGEQLEAIEINGDEFERLRSEPQMGGMHQIKRDLSVRRDFTARDLFVAANFRAVRELRWCYAAQTISRKELVLISLAEKKDGESDSDSETGKRELVVNCENVALGSQLADEIEKALKP